MPRGSSRPELVRGMQRCFDLAAVSNELSVLIDATEFGARGLACSVLGGAAA